jgi:hypothetical protein
MKNIILSAIFIASISCFAQAPRGFYVIGGMSQTELKSSDLLSTPAIGYKAGLIMQMGFHETYNIQAEVIYHHKALNFKAIDGNNFTDVSELKFTSESIDIGAYFNYYILKPEEDQFYLGAQLGVTGSFGEKFQITEPSTSSVTRNYLLPYLLSEDSFSDMNPVNFSGGIGLTGGYNRFRFDLRYSKGFSNLLTGVKTNSYDSSNLYTGPTLNGKLNTISFSVSYLIYKRNKR